jgi:MoaA/NifB/PqqE/SkfB family radical SAM enzyme
MRIPLAVKYPAYLAFRWLGWPRLNPISLTVSLTFQCNHRCKTCDVYSNLVRDLSLEEYEKVFRSIGRGVYYLTVSGGEPFLRPDIVDICRLAKRHLDPPVLLIPTNGLMDKRVPDRVRQILDIFRDNQVIINLSLDGIGPQHDFIRGKPGAWERALSTFAQLKALDAPNLTRGIHTVVSKHNVHDFERIHRELGKLGPDSLICEVAENRVELGTVEHDITPEPDDFDRAVQVMLGEMDRRRPQGVARLVHAFRRQYYQNAARIVRHKRQYPPCQAGFMLAHISPSGEVWACCTEARSFGNLRDHDYDWRSIYFRSPKRHEIRGRIRRQECVCPLANAGYVNILFHPRGLLKVARDLLR